jgi:hypothetical protein
MLEFEPFMRLINSRSRSLHFSIHYLQVRRLACPAVGRTVRPAVAVRSVATKAPEVAHYSNEEIVSATTAALQPCPAAAPEALLVAGQCIGLHFQHRCN